MELTRRVHAGTSEPVPRRPILSPEKLAAEGAPAEIQQVLGWTIDTRRLTVSLPKSKYDIWLHDIQRVQKARRTSTDLLATIEGQPQPHGVDSTYGAAFPNTVTTGQDDYFGG
jgi:hypothetical protein